jgi:uncharacterized protein (TIGR03382 family)
MSSGLTKIPAWSRQRSKTAEFFSTSVFGSVSMIKNIQVGYPPGRTSCLGRAGVLTVRWIGISWLLVLLAACPLAADLILLGDISYQPDTPITGLNSIFLDNFTDLPDLGCSTIFPACGGVTISGLLDFSYTDSGGTTQNLDVPVGMTGPGSTAIYEFDPQQVTFSSAVLAGMISPASFPVNDGNTFTATGSFTSDTLTPDNGFATISVSGNETPPVNASPEPAPGYVVLLVLTTLGAFARRRRGREV